MKFCANLSFMYQYASSLKDRYVLAKKDGFKAVEGGNIYDYPIGELVHVKKETGLQHILINMPRGRNEDQFGCGALTIENPDVFKENLCTALDYASGLNCKLVHVTAGRTFHKNIEVDNFYEKCLRDASYFLGESNNITCLIEPINTWTIKDYYLDSYEKAIDLIKKIDSPYLKLQLDIFHLQHIKGNVTNSILSWLPFIGHIQIAQVPRRNEPDTLGEINYEYVLDVLKSAGYNGWIGLEYTPIADKPVWIQKYGFSL